MPRLMEWAGLEGLGNLGDRQWSLTGIHIKRLPTSSLAAPGWHELASLTEPEKSRKRKGWSDLPKRGRQKTPRKEAAGMALLNEAVATTCLPSLLLHSKGRKRNLENSDDSVIQGNPPPSPSLPWNMEEASFSTAGLGPLLWRSGDQIPGSICSVPLLHKLSLSLSPNRPYTMPGLGEFPLGIDSMLPHTPPTQHWRGHTHTHTFN